MEAAIVGGGIGGLAVAAGLRRRGWGVTVFEQTAGFGVAGAAISLWPNAFRALEAVGVTADLGERVAAAGGVRDWRGRWIMRMDTATLCVAVETQPDLATALRRYDELRRPRTQALVRRSRASGAVGHLSWGPARVVRDALLRALPSSLFVRSLSRLFDWSPEITPIRPAV